MSRELREQFSSARYLKNWLPRLKGNKFIVEGDLINFSAGRADAVFPDRWKTSKIKGRTLPNLVTTGSSNYVLEGSLNFRYVLES